MGWEEVGSGNESRDFWEAGPFPARGAALIQWGGEGWGSGKQGQSPNQDVGDCVFESFRVSLAALAAERVLPGSPRGGPLPAWHGPGLVTCRGCLKGGRAEGREMLFEVCVLIHLLIQQTN